MGFGFIARSDSGSVVASSDYPVFKYAGAFSHSSRVGNESTYSVNTTDRPLVFIRLSDGQAGAVLSITGSAGAWTVVCLTSAIVPIYVFVPLSGNPAGTYGLTIRNSAGALCFDSSQNPLNAEVVGVVSASGVMIAAGDLISFTGASVVTSYSVGADYWVAVSYTGEHQYVGSYKWVLVTVWGYKNVWTCGYVWVNGVYTYVCAWVNTYTSWKEEQYKWVVELVYVTFWHYVAFRRTDWSVRRCCAKKTASGYERQYIEHTFGSYLTAVGYQAVTANVMPIGGGNGYQFPGQFSPQVSGIVAAVAAGYYTADNAFPYSNGTTSEHGNSVAITARSVDYG